MVHDPGRSAAMMRMLHLSSTLESSSLTRSEIELWSLGPLGHLLTYFDISGAEYSYRPYVQI